MRALDYATPEERPEDGYDWFTIDPDEMYPAALEYAQALLEPGADVPMYLRQHVEGLREVVGNSKALWTRAQEPRESLTPSQRADRGQVLEGARLIYTALLREQNGGPIGVHISKSERWRL